MRRLNRNDDGAVAVLVAIVMVAMLAMATIVLDVGSLYAERRQLQNGADAAALALALDCPTNSGCNASTAATGPAGTKANQNANDGTATVASPSGPAVCGIGLNLQPCSPVAGLGPWDCRPPPSGPLSTRYVQVRTETRVSGANLLPPILAQVASPGYAGSTVRACARASWGAPSGLQSQLPLTISACEFQHYTSGGLAPPPPYPANYSGERTIYFHSQTSAAPCPSSSSGADLPGGFGWLDTNEDCVATTDTTNYVDASTGAPAPVECSSAELNAMVGQIVEIPIFDDTNGLSGANGEYHIAGYAGFYLTGFVFPGDKRKSILTGNFPCNGANHCISGVFTTSPTPSGGTIGTGPYMGVTVVQMSG